MCAKMKFNFDKSKVVRGQTTEKGRRVARLNERKRQRKAFRAARRKYCRIAKRQSQRRQKRLQAKLG
jgi:hypothetical protein